MRYTKIILILFFTGFWVSCVPQSSKNEQSCFLESFFNKEIDLLKMGNNKISKSIYFEGKMNDTLLDSPDWKKEFKLFYNNLPDSIELISKYKVVVDTSGTKYREQYSFEDKKGNLKTIELMYIKNALISVRMNIQSLDNLSQQEISFNYNTQKSISSSGRFALLNGEKKEYEIFGEIK